MFILNANKTALVDITGKTLGVCPYLNEKYAIGVSDKVKNNCEDILCLAEYPTEERAKEVLREIASAIGNNFSVYCMPQK